MIESRIVYFEKPGPENTEEVLRIAKPRATELGIKSIVIASKTGDTALKAIEILSGFRLFFIGDSTGFKEPNVQSLSDEIRQKVESKGGIFLTTTHLFMGINRAISQKYKMMASDSTLIADTLRIFGQGMKVVCEIAMMAADSGFVRTDEDIVSIAGTKKGADTAAVLKPLNSRDFFNLKIREILCRPHF